MLPGVCVTDIHCVCVLKTGSCLFLCLFCVPTVNGSVYSWGANQCGQLGLGSRSAQQTFPCKINGLEGAVATMDAGKKHTVFLLQSGDVCSCGDGAHGQTGLGSTADALLPTVALRRQASGRFVDVRCGANHTLVLTSGGEVWACGLGTSGQLGNGDGDDKFRFVKVDKIKNAYDIFAGGNCSFSISSPDEGPFSSATDSKKETTLSLVGFRSRRVLTEQMQKAKNQTNRKPLLDTLQVVFSHVSVLNHSFLRKDIVPRSVSDSLDDGSTGSVLSFDIRKSSGLNVIEAETVYQEMLKVDPVEVASTLLACLNKTMDDFLVNVEGDKLRCYKDPECFRFLLLIWQCPINTLNLSRNFIILKIAKCFAVMPDTARQQVITWIRCDYPAKILDLRLLQSVHRQLDVLHRVSSTSEPFLSDSNTSSVLGLLDMLHQSAQHRPSAVGDIGIDKFYTPVLETLSDESLVKHLQAFRSLSHASPPGPGPGPGPGGVGMQNSASLSSSSSSSPYAFSILQRPFMMSPAVKQRVVALSSVYTQMVHAQHPTANLFAMPPMQHLLGPSAEKYFVMSVRRDFLLQDTLRTIVHTPSEMLLKPMKVAFSGEPGVDAGGLLKEFFQLLTLQLFDLNYGMFVEMPDTRVLWFNKYSWTSPEEFHLVGVLVGLAMYNGVILDLHFPAVLYKKLIGLKLELEDLAELDPQLAKSLQQLLDFPDADAVEDTFCLDFEITSEYLGQIQHHELMPGGKNIPVTGANRELYVNQYLEWFLTSSVERQFGPFKRGFMHTQDASLVALFHPSELQLLVAGTQRLNFHELEKHCTYADGYHREHQTMVNFWSVVHSMSFEQQCQLLKFVTGCKKAPIGGLAKLPFTIGRLCADSEVLPMSHTCFNQLMIPDYSSRHKLATKLEIAIKECEGFGLQ